MPSRKGSRKGSQRLRVEDRTSGVIILKVKLPVKKDSINIRKYDGVTMTKGEVKDRIHTFMFKGTASNISLQKSNISVDMRTLKSRREITSFTISVKYN